MASEFLLITPTDGWIELENASAQFVSVNVDAFTVQDNVLNREWNNLSAPLEQLGVLGENEIILDARFINTETGIDGYRFWYKRQI